MPFMLWGSPRNSRRLRVATRVAGLNLIDPTVILQELSVDIVSAQPSSATPVALKSSPAGVAVVTCLKDTRRRSGPAMSMAVCLVQPPG